MIQRRTIRDLIVRAHSNVTAEKRKAAYSQIVKMDEDVERHFKDVTSATEPAIDVMMRFLAAARFLNGFNTMKWLSVANRIKWMKICAMLWQFMAGKINAFQFAEDHKETGLAMDRRLQALARIRLNQCLVKIDAGAAPDSLQDINRTDQHISAFGFIFFPVGDRLFEIGILYRGKAGRRNAKIPALAGNPKRQANHASTSLTPLAPISFLMSSGSPLSVKIVNEGFKGEI